MKTPLIKIIGLLSICLTVSCNKDKRIDISGVWVYETTNPDSITLPFKSFYPTVWPTMPDEVFYDILYIDSEQIEHPLMGTSNDFSPEDKYFKYYLEGDKMTILKDSLKYEYRFRYKSNRLCIDGGRFCLKRLKDQRKEIDSTIFTFEVYPEFSSQYRFRMEYNFRSNIDNYISNTSQITYLDRSNYGVIDTIVIPEDIRSYITTLLSRIPNDQLDRIYNNRLSDCTETSIDFYAANGGWMGIETCGSTGQNPFEIRALTTNMNWILNKYLRKE